MDEALIAEAHRLSDRYLREVVIACGLCPWAEHAVATGQVRRAVLLDPAPAPEGVLPFIDGLEASPEVEIGLVVYPRFAVTPAAFDRFTERLRQADRARRAAGVLPAFVLAAFHPDGQGGTGNPYQLVPALRRSPDPTVQLVRHATLEAARRTAPRVSDDIAARNLAAMLGESRARLEAAVADIRRDRDETYARLGG